VNSAWLHLRRAEQLGRAIRRAIDASGQEEIELSVLKQASDERGLELARLAGVKDRGTFERANRYVSFDCIGDDQILITPHFRKRGYWEPLPEAQWLTLRRPTDAELGEAAITAVARATA
jgi:hypothetical protein